MFFDSHCSQSSLLKLLEIPPSTTPCNQVSNGVRSVVHSDHETHVEENSRGDVNARQTVGLSGLLAKCSWNPAANRPNVIP